MLPNHPAPLHNPASPRARPAPLHHPDGLWPADAAALHPTPARGHCPVAPVRWDIALPVVSWPLCKRWPKGHGTAGHIPLPGGTPERRYSQEGAHESTHGHCGTQWRCSSGPRAAHSDTSLPAPTCSCPQHPAHPSRLRCRSRWSHCQGSPRGLYCLYDSPSSRPWASPPTPLSLRC